MKYLITLLLVPLYWVSNAQVIVNGININNIERVKYIEVNCDLRPLAGKVYVYVDYGQNLSISNERPQIRGKEDKVITFVSNMQVLNFFDANGWDLVEKETIEQNGRDLKSFLFIKEE